MLIERMREQRNGASDPPRHHIWEAIGRSCKDEAEHFIKCPGCGGWIDCRDLGQALEHYWPLPHPAQDQPQ
jgi:hypothetical protein